MGAYEVSDYGRARRARKGPHTHVGYLLKPRVVHGGYIAYRFSVNDNPVTILAAGMVAGMFMGPKPIGLEINHKDGNKAHNCKFNLEYVTRSENHLHAHRLGLKASGEDHYAARLTEQDVRMIRDSREANHVIAKRLGVSTATVSHARTGRSWRHVI